MKPRMRLALLTLLVLCLPATAFAQSYSSITRLYVANDTWTNPGGHARPY